MGIRVAIVGSLSRSNVIFAEESGEFVSARESYGTHWRVFNSDVVSRHVRNLIGPIVQELGNRAWGSSDSCGSLSIAISGVDPRFGDSGMPLLASELGIEESALVHSGVAEVAHCGALLMGPGVLVRSGVSCSVFGVNSSKQTHLTNAYSSPIGDLGSAYDIGQRVFFILQKADDGRATKAERQFSRASLEGISVACFQELVQKIDDHGKFTGAHTTMRHVASLARGCIHLADNGNEIAEGIVDKVVDDLVLGVRTVVKELALSEAQPISLVFRGGISRNAETHSFCDRVVLALRQSGGNHTFRVEQGQFSPIVGAILFALAGARSLPPQETLSRFLGTLPNVDEAPFLYAHDYYSGTSKEQDKC